MVFKGSFDEPKIRQKLQRKQYCVSMLLLVTVASFVLFLVVANDRPTEEERVRLWYSRNNTWPPHWQSESESFSRAMEARERELMMIPGAHERWENFMQFTQSRMVPRFTPHGFKLTKIPEPQFRKLREALDNALQHWDGIRNEAIIDIINTPIASKFVDLHGLDWEILNELTEFHEQWVDGMKLRPTSIYGLRLNRNGSSLTMHYDKVHTHVISSIMHVGHEYFNDSEPWPIEIEDHDGNLHAINLEPGDMLFYESASCLHGRRKVLKGKYYASIFGHYQPVDKNIWNFNIEDIIANVPPHWSEGVVEDKGSRWAGQGLTIDSRIPDGAPPRIINGQLVTDIEKFYEEYHNGMEL